MGHDDVHHYIGGFIVHMIDHDNEYFISDKICMPDKKFSPTNKGKTERGICYSVKKQT